MSWSSSLNIAYQTGRKLVIAVMGFTIVLFGIVLIFTPGPAFVFIPLGLAILGLEFAWARRWLLYLKQRAHTMTDRYRQAMNNRNNR